MFAVCPACKSNDAIRSVAGMVEQSKNELGLPMTQMGSILEHPSKPAGLGCGTWLFGLMVVAIVFTPIFYIGLFVNIDHPYLQYVLFRFIVFGIGGILAGIVAAILLILAWRLIRSSSYRWQVASWETKMERWNRLYYCGRDHILFDPETGETAQPENIQNFLAAGTKLPEGTTKEEAEAARKKSFTKPAVAALALEFLPFLYLVGLAVNIVYLVKGTRAEKIAGKGLPGVTFLKVLFWFNVIGLAAMFALQLTGTVVFGILPSLR